MAERHRINTPWTPQSSRSQEPTRRNAGTTPLITIEPELSPQQDHAIDNQRAAALRLRLRRMIEQMRQAETHSTAVHENWASNQLRDVLRDAALDPLATQPLLSTTDQRRRRQAMIVDPFLAVEGRQIPTPTADGQHETVTPVDPLTEGEITFAEHGVVSADEQDLGQLTYSRLQTVQIQPEVSVMPDGHEYARLGSEDGHADDLDANGDPVPQSMLNFAGNTPGPYAYAPRELSAREIMERALQSNTELMNMADTGRMDLDGLESRIRDLRLHFLDHLLGRSYTPSPNGPSDDIRLLEAAAEDREQRLHRMLNELEDGEVMMPMMDVCMYPFVKDLGKGELQVHVSSSEHYSEYVGR